MFALIVGIALMLTVLGLVVHHQYRGRQAQIARRRLRMSDAEMRTLANDVVRRFVTESGSQQAF